MDSSEVTNEIKALVLKLGRSRAKGQEVYEFQGKSLYSAIKKQSRFSRTDINLALIDLFKENYLCGTPLEQPFEMPKKVIFNIPKEDLPEHEQQWLDCIEVKCLSTEDKVALKGLGRKLQGFSLEHQESLIDGLYNLRDCQDQHMSEPKYNVSARYLLGSSKLLEVIQKEATIFGIKTDQFSSAYRYVCVAGNKNPEAVIIVENPHSFETAVRADRELRFAWISSYGFGISLDKNYKYGELLATNITENQNDIIPLTRAGQPQPLSELLQKKNIYFWGDLDIGGLSIYQRLKAHLPELQLSRFYNYMLDQLMNGKHHPLVKAVAKDGQKPFHSQDRAIEYLLPLLQNKGVDQEIVTEDQILIYAGKPFTLTSSPT